MHEPVGTPVSPTSEDDAALSPGRSDLPRPIPAPAPQAALVRPGSFGRLLSLVISVGLAWALVVAITAWLLGLFLARG
jgi:hypothetical protein